MKIGETPRVSTTAEIRRTVAKPDAATTSPVAAPRPIDDTMSVMGIPEPELTPKVREALMTLMEEVGKLRADLDRTRSRLVHLERLADQDTLTPIANRRAFVGELSRVMSYTERYEEPSSLVYFDVNSFKDINDNSGHAAGDAALLAVADILVQKIRESDTVGRLAGDEFGIILARTDRDGAIEKAETLASAIGHLPFEWQGTPIPLEVAYGVHTFSAGGDPGKALAEADRATYVQKQNMKNGAKGAGPLTGK